MAQDTILNRKNVRTPVKMTFGGMKKSAFF